jgi:hypothetical protein
MMKIAIHQPHCFPWLGYLHKLASVDHFVILDSTQFMKQEWQNRNYLIAGEEKLLLTLPVIKAPFDTRIMDKRIDYSHLWPNKMWHRLEGAYAKAPYWKTYRDRLKSLFFEKHERLVDFSGDMLRFLMAEFGIATPIVNASELGTFQSLKTDLVIDICRATSADVYLSGGGARDYLEVDKLMAARVTLEWQSFVHPVYPQCTSTAAEFVPNLCALDLLLNCGPQSAGLLTGSATATAKLEQVA